MISQCCHGSNLHSIITGLGLGLYSRVLVPRDQHFVRGGKGVSTNSRMGVSLQFLKDGLMKLHVPYSYGFAIILLTLIVKAATYPLTKKQVTPIPSECILQDTLPLILGVFGLLYKSLNHTYMNSSH